MSKPHSRKRRQDGDDSPDRTVEAATESVPQASAPPEQQPAPSNAPSAQAALPKRKYTLSPEYQELVDLLDKAVPTWRPQPKSGKAQAQPQAGLRPPVQEQEQAGSSPPSEEQRPVQEPLPVQLPVQVDRRPVQKKAPEPPKPQPIITDDYKALVGLLGKKSDGDELARLADKIGARVTRHRAGKHETGIAFQGGGLWWVTDAGLVSAVFIELRDPEKGFDSFRGSLGFGTNQQQCHASMEKVDAQFIDSGRAPQHGGASKLHIWERYIHDETLLRFNFDQESGKLHNLSVLRLEAAPVRPSGRATCEQIIENHLSPAAQGLLSRAKQEAQRLDHDEIGTEQLLSALLATESGVTHDLFHQFNLTADHVRTEVDKILPRGQGKTEYWLSPRLRAVIMVAWDEACRREANQVDDTHLLLALLRLRNGFAIRILETLGIDIDHMRNALFDSLE